MSMNRILSNDKQRLQDVQELARKTIHIVKEDQIAFTGSEVIQVPGLLLCDPILSNDEKIYWMFLRRATQANSYQRMPDQTELAAEMRISRASIITYTKMLRATRWLTIVGTHKENNLPTRHFYVIHERPISIEETLGLDGDYIAFLEESCKGRTERLVQYCRNTLAVRANRQLHNLAGLGLVGNSDNGDASAVKNFDSGDTSDVKNFDSGDTSGVKNFDSGDASDVKNFDSGDASGVKNFDSGDTSDVKNFDSGAGKGDVYITAREHAHTRTYTRAPGGIIKTFGFNNTYSHPSDGGCGGKVDEKFTFLEKPLFAEILRRLNRKYGKGTMRTVLGLLKRGHFRYDGVDFVHWADEEDVTIALMSLLSQQVNAPGKYLEALLYRAHCGELTYLGDQHAQVQAIRKELAEKALLEQAAAVRICDGSVLLDEYNRAYYVAEQWLDGETLVRAQGSGFSRINAGYWHGHSAEEAKLAIVQGKLRFADETTTQRIATVYQNKRTEEDAEALEFYRNFEASNSGDKA